MSLQDKPKPLSRETLLARERCCGNGCTNCPYSPPHIWENRVHLHVPVQVLNQYGLSVKLVNALEKAGYIYIADLQKFRHDTVIVNVGDTSKKHIAAALRLFLADLPNYFGKNI